MVACKISTFFTYIMQLKELCGPFLVSQWHEDIGLPFSDDPKVAALLGSFAP